jgi:aminopeptidase YwaD
MRQVACSLALAVLAAGAVAPAQPSRVAAEVAFAEAVDAAALQQHVRDLVALGPRMGGTPSGDRAAAHLERFFSSLGLDTATVEDAPLQAHWEDSWLVELQPGGSMESAWPYGFSPPVDPAREGSLIAIESLSRARPDASWDGAVIYTPSDVAPAYRRLAAGERRPLAILTSAPHSPAKNLDWSRPGALPEGASHPIPVFALSYTDGRTLASAAAAGERRVRLSLASHVREAPSRTVIATLRGADPERYYLVSAHGDSDSGGPGADDNASGVATVMELARILTSQAGAGAFAPRVSVRFVIWGAEYHSARSYIEREGEEIGRCLGVINFDETGTGAEREAIYVEGNDVPWNEPMLRVLEGVGIDYLDRPGFWPEFTTNPTQSGTDSYAFLPREYKGGGYTGAQIPSTTIYTAAWDETITLTQTPGWASKGWRGGNELAIDYSLYYHSSADTPENTTDREPQNMVRAVKLAGIGLLRLLTR